MFEYWKNTLSNKEREQYDRILCAVKRGDSSADMLVPLSAIKNVYSCVFNDHPELYYANPVFTCSWQLGLSYIYDATMRSSIDRSFASFKNELVGQGDTSDVDKVLSAIYLITRNCRYEIDIIYNQNAASAIHFHSAQCSGFAAAFKYAMDQLGIWTIIVNGSARNESQSGPHAWNIVQLNNAYYHVDITGFSAVRLSNRDQLKMYDCIFRSDDELRCAGYSWNEAEVPECSGTPIRLLPSAGGAPSSATSSNSRSDIQKFTRLYDIQRQIFECINKRITYCEFCATIPSYSDEKICNYIMSTIKTMLEPINISCSYRIGCRSGIFYIEFTFK